MRPPLRLELLESRANPAAQIVADIYAGAMSGNPSLLTDVNGTLFFRATDPLHKNELWKTDGTLSGTVLVKDISPGLATTEFSEFTAVNDTLFFVANPPRNAQGYENRELWKSDGTAAGTVLVKDINPKGASRPRELTPVDGKVFFVADDGVTGKEVWVSDGTAAGTRRLTNIHATGSSDPNNLVNVNGTVYFSATDGTTNELWKTDGTAAGTKLVKEITATYKAPFDGGLIFVGDNGVAGPELWKSDGTPEGTILVKDIFEGPFGSNIGLDTAVETHFTELNGALYFGANDGEAHGQELWKTNGTPEGTVLVRDISPGSFGSSAGTEIVRWGDALYFTADVLTSAGELWKTDGAAGAVRVKDFQTGPGFTNLRELTAGEDALYFGVDDGEAGHELWRSNGTGNGTARVADINPGGASASPSNLAVVNGSVIFAATTANQGRELWAVPRLPAADAAPVLDAAPTVTLAPVGKNAKTHRGDSVEKLVVNATDADGDHLGVAVTGFQGIAGQWQHGLFPTGPWTNFGDVSEAAPLTLSDTRYVRFVPAANAVGYAGMNFRAWDRTLGSAAADVAWVPVGVTTTFDAQGHAVLTGTVEDALNPAGTLAKNLLGVLVTDFPANTALGLAVTDVAGDGVWQVRVAGAWTPITDVRDTHARLLKPADVLRFLPDPDWNGEATIDYRAVKVTPAMPMFGDVTDPGTGEYGTLSQTGALLVKPVNDRPTVDTAIPRVFDANPQTVAALTAGATDGDGAVNGIAVTRAAAKNGAWEYRLSPSGAWAILKSVSAGAALLLDAEAEIRFVPTPGKTTAGGSFDYKIWDDSSPFVAGTKKTTAGTAFSTLAETATCSLGNTAPTFNAGPAPAFPGTTRVRTPAALSVATLTARMTDADAGFLRGVAVSSLTGAGTWRYSLNGGKTWAVVGDVATRRLLLRSTDKLSYTPDAGTPETAELTFHAWDQTAGVAGDRVAGTNNSFSLAALTATLFVA